LKASKHATNTAELFQKLNQAGFDPEWKHVHLESTVARSLHNGDVVFVLTDTVVQGVSQCHQCLHHGAFW
jgi:hypothetical protein